MAPSRILKLASKVTGIEPDKRLPRITNNLEKDARRALAPADIYIEKEPTVGDVLRELKPTKAGVIQYFRELFPCTGWVPRYNL